MNALHAVEHEIDAHLAQTERDESAAERAELAIITDPARLADIDLIESERLDGDAYVELFSTLADASQSGLVATLRGLMGLNALHTEQLRKMLNVCDRMAKVRNDAVAEAAGNELERQMGRAA